MPKQETPGKVLTLASTKKEMLDAYRELQGQLKEKRETEMKPEQKIEEKKNKEAVEVADSLSMDGIAKEVGSLKSEIGGMLARLSDKLEEEIGEYLQVKKAVAVREKELQEIYEIEKTATTLTALLEVQQRKRMEFETEMAEAKEELETEIESSRAQWDKERADHDAEIKERDTAEKKKRDRDIEDYKYRFEREQQLAREEFEFNKARLEREAQYKKEELERDLAEREKVLAKGEGELQQLRAKAAAFPAELEAAVAKAVKDTSGRLTLEAQNKEELLKREFKGEQNVLLSKIEALQQTVKTQTAQIATLSAQLEKAYSQVQDIAVKAIEGPSAAKPFPHAQPPGTELSRP